MKLYGAWIVSVKKMSASKVYARRVVFQVMKDYVFKPFSFWFYNQPTMLDQVSLTEIHLLSCAITLVV